MRAYLIIQFLLLTLVNSNAIWLARSHVSKVPSGNGNSETRHIRVYYVYNNDIDRKSNFNLITVVHLDLYQPTTHGEKFLKRLNTKSFSTPTIPALSGWNVIELLGYEIEVGKYYEKDKYIKVTVEGIDGSNLSNIGGPYEAIGSPVFANTSSYNSLIEFNRSNTPIFPKEDHLIRIDLNKLSTLTNNNILNFALYLSKNKNLDESDLLVHSDSFDTSESNGISDILNIWTKFQIKENHPDYEPSFYKLILTLDTDKRERVIDYTDDFFVGFHHLIVTHGVKSNPFREKEKFLKDFSELSESFSFISRKLNYPHGSTYASVKEWDSTTDFTNLIFYSMLQNFLIDWKNKNIDNASPLEAWLILMSINSYDKVYKLKKKDSMRHAEFASLQFYSEIKDLVSHYPFYKIHLIGYSRGAGINSLLSRKIYENGGSVANYVSLDGFSEDWPYPSNLLSDIDISNVTIADNKFNFMVEDSLDSVLLNKLQSMNELQTHFIDLLLINLKINNSNSTNRKLIIEELNQPDDADHPYNWKAPPRAQYGFKDILAHGSNGSLSNHFNIVETFKNNYALDYFNSFLGNNMIPQNLAIETRRPQHFIPLNHSPAEEQLVLFEENFQFYSELFKNYEQIDNVDYESHLIKLIVKLAITPSLRWDLEHPESEHTQIMYDNGECYVKIPTQIPDEMYYYFDLPESREFRLSFDLASDNKIESGFLDLLINDEVVHKIYYEDIPTIHDHTALIQFSINAKSSMQYNKLTFRFSPEDNTTTSHIYLDNIKISKSSLAQPLSLRMNSNEGSSLIFKSSHSIDNIQLLESIDLYDWHLVPIDKKISDRLFSIQIDKKGEGKFFKAILKH